MGFSIRLRELRKISNMTQKDLSIKINASKSKVSMWESEKRDPNTDDIILLANLFEVSSDYLLGISNVRSPKQINQDKTLDTNETELFALIKKLPSREKIKLIGIVENKLSELENSQNENKTDKSSNFNNSDDFRDPNIVESMISQKNVG